MVGLGQHAIRKRAEEDDPALVNDLQVSGAAQGNRLEELLHLRPGQVQGGDDEAISAGRRPGTVRGSDDRGTGAGHLQDGSANALASSRRTSDGFMAMGPV